MDAADTKRPLALRFMARRLRVRVGWLRAEANAGRLPHLRAGDQLFFNPELVEAVLLERASMMPTPDAEAVHA